MNDYLMIGTVLKPQGIRGESKIKSHAAQIELFRKWKTLYLKTPEGFAPISVRTERIRDGFVYAVLDGHSSADEAERLRGCDLYVRRDDAAQPEKGAFLIADLIDCSAVDEAGCVLGVLTEVLQYGSVDTWVFRTETGTLMVPALKAVFPDVKPEQKRILVNREKLEEVAVRS